MYFSELNKLNMSDTFKNIVKNLISPELISGRKEYFFFSFRSHNNEYVWEKNPVTSNVFVVLEAVPCQ